MKLTQRVAALLTVIIISICALMIAAIFKARREAQVQERLRAAYLAETLAEEAADPLNVVASISEVIEERIAAQTNSELSKLKRQVQKYVPSLADILIIGADGKLAATAVPGDFEAIDFSDRDYFRAHRDDAKNSFRIGEPVRVRPAGRVIIPITRRLETIYGAFAGVVIFTLDPEQMVNLYRGVDPGIGGRLDLVGTDGIIRAGFSGSGTKRTSMVEPLAIEAKAIAGIQSSPAGYAEVGSRIYAWRKLDSFPLVAVVGLGKAEAMGGVYRQAIFLSGLGILSAGLVLATAALLAREISRRITQAQALEETNAKLSAAYIDITERERHAEQINLLLREVNHRSKNMLSVVQAIARQTLAANPADFIERFAERIEALAASQDLLVKNEWRGVDLHELVRSQLGHFKDLVDKRIELRGPPLLVSASGAQTIGMALHELATNAGKYGALSDGIGRVEVHWSLEPGEGRRETFVISWRERGGPTVTAPAQAGFGSTVLCQVAKESLDAQVELNYAPTGLVWRLQCPAGEVMETG